jgi:hypothetical protein
MEAAETKSTDLRALVQDSYGKPLASSASASLWRCPRCAARTRALLLVSAAEFRCLGRCGWRGGVDEWMQMTRESGAVQAHAARMTGSE